MSFLALFRLYPIAKAVAFTVLGVIFLELLLRVSFGVTPKHVPPPFDPSTITKFSGRVAAFEKLRSDGDVTDQGLVAIVGMSTVQADLDSSILGSNDPENRKWLVMGAGGRNFTQLNIYSRPLLSSAIRPRLIVLGVHEFMLRSNDRDLWDEPITPFRHMLHGQLGYLAKDVSYLDRNHGRIEDAANLLAIEATDRLRQFADLPMYRWYPVDTHPFDTWNEYVGRRATAEYLTTQLSGFSRELVPEQFDAENGQPLALRVLVQQIHDRGSKAILLLMPEHSQFRSLYPPIVAVRFAHAVANAATASHPLRVVDLRDVMPDDVFFDYTHLNAEGRLRLSTLLGARINN